MRITSVMMANTSLINLNRNMRNLGTLEQQVASTKKIQVPSDDPIIASRALKFRTNLTETEQFLRNIQSGLGWMDVTSSSFTSVIENLMKTINERCVTAANGTNTAADKQAIVAELRQLVDQIGLEMNQSYAGRYVFSGFRTDQPPVFTDDNKLSYIITQQFNLCDIEKTQSYQKRINEAGYDSTTSQPIMNAVNILKLAYSDVVFNPTMVDENGNLVVLPDIQGATGSGNPPAPPLQYKIVTKSITDMDAYTPGIDKEGNPILDEYDNPIVQDGSVDHPYIVHYIKETGELVLNDEAAKTFRDGTTITYHKEDYKKGELNPMVYFDCIEVVGKDKAIPDTVYTLEIPAIDMGTGAFTFSAIKTDTNGSTTFPMLDSPTAGPVITLYGSDGKPYDYQLWNDLDGPSGYLSPSSVITHEDLGPPPSWEAVFAIEDNNLGFNISVTQRVIMEDNTYKIEYAVMNFGSTPVDFDFKQHLHPSIDDDNDLVYSGTGIKSDITLTHSDPTKPNMTGVITIGKENKPTAVNIGASAGLNSGAFEVIWSGLAGPTDEPVLMSTSYGIQDPEGETLLVRGKEYNMDDQYIYYECATNTFVAVNSLAKNVYTDKMYADLKRLLEFVESIEISDSKVLEEYYGKKGLEGDDLKNAVDTQLNEEKAKMQAALFDRFNNMLYLIERHTAQATTEQTSLGSRMYRMELLQSRQEQDEYTYSKLVSDNEDTDMQKAIMLKATAEMAYQAALQVSAGVTRSTLADFIR